VDIALDGEWIEYTNVEGFGGTGGVDLATHTLTPFGWRNIWVLKTGVQYHATQKLDVRLGFNWGQTPIRQEIVLASTGTPTTFQKHFCGGFSMKLMPNVTADAGIYFVPREHVKGPSLDINTGVVPNSTYDMSNRLISGQVAFNFHF
jgi:long-chain fatty acid transport protein